MSTGHDVDLATVLMDGGRVALHLGGGRWLLLPPADALDAGGRLQRAAEELLDRRTQQSAGGGGDDDHR